MFTGPFFVKKLPVTLAFPDVSNRVNFIAYWNDNGTAKLIYITENYKTAKEEAEYHSARQSESSLLNRYYTQYEEIRTARPHMDWSAWKDLLSFKMPGA